MFNNKMLIITNLHNFFHPDLIQRLRSRERERERRNSLQRQRSRDRDGNRRTLSYDAPPFYLSESGPSGGTSEGSTDNENLSAFAAHRRQLGERLYPKVLSLQPVSVLNVNYIVYTRSWG